MNEAKSQTLSDRSSQIGKPFFLISKSDQFYSKLIFFSFDFSTIKTFVQYGRGCSVLWRIFSTVEDIQYCGGYSVPWRMFSTVEDVQYYGGYSVPWRMLSNVEDVQYCRGYLVLSRIFSTVVDIQYCGGGGKT